MSILGTTQKIKEGLDTHRFKDVEFMESFDVAFAQRFIKPYWDYWGGKELSSSWLVSFDTNYQDISLLQQIILGMNAHINFDLAITAAELAPGERIYQIKDDFMLVNTMLEELVDEVQSRLSRVSPTVRIIDWLGGRMDESLISFGLRRARGFAWLNAVSLASLYGYEREEFIRQIDLEIAQLSTIVTHPPSRLFRIFIWVTRRLETKKMSRIIPKIQEENAVFRKAQTKDLSS